MSTTKQQSDRDSWVKWLEGYGIGKFYDAFVEYAQNAQGKCQYCGQSIYLDIVEGGGVPDWGSSFGDSGGLDYGCPDSPDTGDNGTGGHLPVKLER